MEWSNDIVMRFLELYKREFVIWDPKHPYHKDRGWIQEAWKRIEEELGIRCSVNELKKKKESLMATFRKLSQKVKASMKNANEHEEVFKPDWFAYDYMAQFLREVYKPKTVTHSKGHCQDIQIKENCEAANVSRQDNDVARVCSIPVQSDSSFKSPSPPRTAVASKKRKLDKMVDSESGNSTPDECSLYAKLLAKKLRALDENTRDFAMLKIDQLIFRLKQIDKLALESSPYTYTSSNVFASSPNSPCGTQYQNFESTEHSIELPPPYRPSPRSSFDEMPSPPSCEYEVKSPQYHELSGPCKTELREETESTYAFV